MVWVCGYVCVGGEGGAPEKAEQGTEWQEAGPPEGHALSSVNPGAAISGQQLSASRKCGSAPSPSMKRTSHRILGASTPISALACCLKPQLLFLNIYLFIQLLQILVVACGNFSCSMQNL